MGRVVGWKTGRVRIDLNSEGIRELLKSDGVADEIQRRAELVAAHATGLYSAHLVGSREAGENMPDETIKAEVFMGEGAVRARARVVAEHPAAPAVEAKYRVLGASMDAARA